jgi:adenylate cyclase
MSYGSPESEWRAFLSGDHPIIRRDRRLRGLMPSEPRCKNCHAPFGPPGGWLMRLRGRGPWAKNPRFCRVCFNFISAFGVSGAEIPVSLLFADVRGSTGLGESMSPSEFTRLMNRFYAAATRALIARDAVVDKLVGDEVVAFFISAMTGSNHAGAAIEAAREVLSATRRVVSSERELPVGVGVHTGVAFVGAVGSAGEVTDFTALGDPVNVTARLASSAGAGEILVSEAAAAAAGMPGDGLERRRLEVRGRSEPLDVYVIRG